jgi:hypothetical protein
MNILKFLGAVVLFSVSLIQVAHSEEREPLVAHVVVALCDNIHQRIVPVPIQLGRGNQPKSNLYWGAMYGVKGFFSRQKHWQPIHVNKPLREHVLDQVAYSTKVNRKGQETTLIVYAEAWRGSKIKHAIQHYLESLAGQHPETLEIQFQNTTRSIGIASQANLISYIGHNGLMDFDLKTPEGKESPGLPSITLACKSEEYFRPHFQALNTQGLITTTGLMAPEAYTLEAALIKWAEGKNTESVHEASAAAYADYQKANIQWARRLFKAEPKM